MLSPEELEDWHMLPAIFPTLSESDDLVIWPHFASGCFLVKFLYSRLVSALLRIILRIFGVLVYLSRSRSFFGKRLEAIFQLMIFGVLVYITTWLLNSAPFVLGLRILTTFCSSVTSLSCFGATLGVLGCCLCSGLLLSVA